MVNESKNIKELQVKMAIDDTKLWALNHPFLSEGEVFKHFKRSLKKFHKDRGGH